MLWNYVCWMVLVCCLLLSLFLLMKFGLWWIWCVFMGGVKRESGYVWVFFMVIERWLCLLWVCVILEWLCCLWLMGWLMENGLRFMLCRFLFWFWSLVMLLFLIIFLVINVWWCVRWLRWLVCVCCFFCFIVLILILLKRYFWNWKCFCVRL